VAAGAGVATSVGLGLGAEGAPHGEEWGAIQKLLQKHYIVIILYENQNTKATLGEWDPKGVQILYP
jgi:hypothetical protein